MERNWTTAQRAAMDTRDKTLLVSAAAGSGKTATLTERIIRSLTDPENPAHIEDMLISECSGYPRGGSRIQEDGHSAASGWWI